MSTTITDTANHLEEAERDWEERTLEPTLKRSPETKRSFTTVSLAPVDRLYTPNS